MKDIDCNLVLKKLLVIDYLPLCFNLLLVAMGIYLQSYCNYMEIIKAGFKLMKILFKIFLDKNSVFPTEATSCFRPNVFKAKVFPDSFVLKSLIELDRTFPYIHGDVDYFPMALKFF